MEKVIGNTNLFALKIDIIRFKPHLWGKSALIINNIQLGVFEEENVLAAFIISLSRIYSQFNTLWLEELEGLSCKEMFNKINPFFKDPNSFYNLSELEQENIIKYDRFNFHFGENFDDYLINSVVKANTCKFLWVSNLRKVDATYSDNLIQCFDIPLDEIHSTIKEFYNIIPSEFWPTLIEKLD